MPTVITSKAEWEDILQKNEKVVVDFHATWCGPCKMISPFFESLQKDFENIVFCKIDVDDVSDVAEVCGISAMPTFQFYMAGKKIDELCGASKDKLKEKLEKLKSA